MTRASLGSTTPVAPVGGDPGAPFPEEGHERPAAATATLSGIGFTYPSGTEALSGLDLEFPRGSVTGIVGPSGCGKSTTLALLAGLTAPTSGTVTLEFDDSGAHPVAMVFQQDTLLPWLSVEDNVGLHFRFRGGRKQAQDEIDALLNMVGLRDFAKAYPKQLSGGMRRRVAFLSAVAPKPQLMLLDEPFSSVDEPTRVKIHQEVLDIVRRRRTTTVLVTHDLAEAITLCHRVVIMSARPGRIVASHEIPFGEERNVLALRDRPEYLELYGRLWHDLSAEIARSSEGEST